MTQNSSPEFILESKWLHLRDFYDITCEDIHPGVPCSHEIFQRFIVVAKNNNKLYFILHFIPFLIFGVKKLRSKTKKQILWTVGRLIKRYLGSMLFMSSFVSTYKAVICVREWTDQNIAKGAKKQMPLWFLSATVLASLTMFFQEQRRRKQISIYAFVRALPAFYNLLSRRGLLTIPYVGEIVFVLVFALLSVCYHKHQHQLSFASIFQKIWGES